MALKIAIPALRDEELISLYKEIYLKEDKRVVEIENEFKKRLIKIKTVLDNIKKDN